MRKDQLRYEAKRVVALSDGAKLLALGGMGVSILSLPLMFPLLGIVGFLGGVGSYWAVVNRLKSFTDTGHWLMGTPTPILAQWDAQGEVAFGGAGNVTIYHDPVEAMLAREDKAEWSYLKEQNLQLMLQVGDEIYPDKRLRPWLYELGLWYFRIHQTLPPGAWLKDYLESADAKQIPPTATMLAQLAAWEIAQAQPEPTPVIEPEPTSFVQLRQAKELESIATAVTATATVEPIKTIEQAQPVSLPKPEPEHDRPESTQLSSAPPSDGVVSGLSGSGNIPTVPRGTDQQPSVPTAPTSEINPPSPETNPTVQALAEIALLRQQIAQLSASKTSVRDLPIPTPELVVEPPRGPVEVVSEAVSPVGSTQSTAFSLSQLEEDLQPLNLKAPLAERMQAVLDRAEADGFRIKSNVHRPIILIVGPSQSGKSTIAHLANMARKGLGLREIAYCTPDESPAVAYDRLIVGADFGNKKDEVIDWKRISKEWEQITRIIANAPPNQLRQIAFTLDEVWRCFEEGNVNTTALLNAILQKGPKTCGAFTVITQSNTLKTIGGEGIRAALDTSATLFEPTFDESELGERFPTGNYKVTMNGTVSLWTVPEWMLTEYNYKGFLCPVQTWLKWFPELAMQAPLYTPETQRNEIVSLPTTLPQIPKPEPKPETKPHEMVVSAPETKPETKPETESIADPWGATATETATATVIEMISVIPPEPDKPIQAMHPKIVDQLTANPELRPIDIARQSPNYTPQKMARTILGMLEKPGWTQTKIICHLWGSKAKECNAGSGKNYQQGRREFQEIMDSLLPPEPQTISSNAANLAARQLANKV